MLTVNDDQHSAIQTCMDRLADDVLERGSENLLRIVYSVEMEAGEQVHVGVVFGRPSNYMKVICYVPEDGVVETVASFDNYHREGIALGDKDSRSPMRWFRFWSPEEEAPKVTVPGTPFLYIDHDSCWRDHSFNPREWFKAGLVGDDYYPFKSTTLVSASLETFAGKVLRTWEPPAGSNLDLATALLTLRALWSEGGDKLVVDMTICKRVYEEGRWRDPRYPTSDDINEDPNWSRYRALLQFDATGRVTHAQTTYDHRTHEIKEIEALPVPEWLHRGHLLGEVFDTDPVSIRHLFLTFPRWGTP